MLVSLFSRIVDLKTCKETQTQVFSSEYCKVLKTPFFCRAPPVAASAKWWNSTNTFVFFSDKLTSRTSWKHNRNISNLLKLVSLRFESLSIFLSSHENTHENNTSKTSYENTRYVMKYAHIYKHSETIESAE